MLDPQQKELRQIKRILLGILACLLILVVAVAPRIAAFLLILAIAGAVSLAISETARARAADWWDELSSYWRT